MISLIMFFDFCVLLFIVAPVVLVCWLLIAAIRWLNRH